MKATALRLPSSAALLAALVLSPGIASAADHFKAEASFAGSDASGCVSQRVFVFVKDKKAFATVEKFDYCQEKQLLYAIARNVNLKGGGLVVDKTLGSATLNAQVEFIDKLKGNKKTATLQVTWSAVGDPVTVDGVNDVDEPGKKGSRVLRKTSRLAAAQGAIVLDNQTIDLGQAEDAVIVLAQT